MVSRAAGLMRAVELVFDGFDGTWIDPAPEICDASSLNLSVLAAPQQSPDIRAVSSSLIPGRKVQ